ncbi:hypothetical protein FRB95_001213 [Tulasnella sp. JGI-2019a]|nr:hypothetical protein FRB95_001213 [Tulasnella sp. JGI-2019a]
MVNIKTLLLRDFGWLGTPYQNLVHNAISSTVSLSSLTDLTLLGAAFDRPPRHEDYGLELSLLLRGLPLLECLRLQSGDWDLQGYILQSDVPRLGRLQARSHEAKLLVPGRPITGLCITELFELPDPDEWRFLAASAVPLTFFAIDDTESPEVLKSVLHSVAKHFKDVQKLRIFGCIYSTMDVLVKEFPSFPSLRNIHIRGWGIHKGGEKKVESRRLDAITHIRSVNPQFQNLAINNW